MKLKKQIFVYVITFFQTLVSVLVQCRGKNEVQRPKQRHLAAVLEIRAETSSGGSRVQSRDV